MNNIYNRKGNKIVFHSLLNKCIYFIVSISFQSLSNCINIFDSGNHSVDSTFVMVFHLTFHKTFFHAPTWFYNYSFNDYIVMYRYIFMPHC